MAAQIRSVARMMLRAGGVNAISLRATARVIGVTPAAIYRYYPSWQALTDSLRHDILEELDAQFGFAGSQVRGDCPAVRLGTMARAFRRWALDHPAEFWLALGPAGPALDTGIPGFIITLLGCPAEFAPAAAEWRDDSRAAAGSVVVSAWARLYGLIATDVAGHISWPSAAADAFFEAELAELCEHLAGARPSSRKRIL